MNTTIKLIIAGTALLLNQAVFAQAGGLPDFTKLVKQNHEAVVNISTRNKVKQTSEPELSEDKEANPLDELIKRFK